LLFLIAPVVKIIVIIFTLSRYIPEGFKKLRPPIQKLGKIIRPESYSDE